MEVWVRNAVEISPDTYPFHGIRLGKDFFTNSLLQFYADFEAMPIGSNSNENKRWRVGMDSCVEIEGG
jgi:hypothetical protein